VQGINATTGCTNLMTGSATVTVNPLPSLFNVTQTGGTSYCAGGTGIVVGLNGSTTNVNYQLYIGGLPFGSPVPGLTGSPISFGAQFSAGTYTVVGTNTITGCSQAMTGVATISITPLPTAYSITGGGTFCTGSAGPAIGLSNSDVGVNYTLNQGVTTITTMAGTGSPLSFGPQSTLGAYTITALSTITGCSNTMSGTVSVSVNPLPVAQTVSGGGSYCAGGTGVTISLVGSQLGFVYQVVSGGGLVGSPVTGTGSGISMGLVSGAGTYSVTGTNPATGCSALMSGTATVTVLPLPTVYNFFGGGAFCAGGAGVVDSLSGSVIGTNYQLLLGGVAVGVPVPGLGTPMAWGGLTAPGTYTATASAGGCTVAMTGSAVVVVNPLPNLYNVTGTGSYCAGGTGLHVGLNGSDAGVSYQVIFGGSPITSPVAGTGAALDFGAFTSAGAYSVVAFNTATSCTNNMTGTAVVSINPLPAIKNVTGGGSYCAGGTGVHVGLNGSAPGISYQLFNGIATSGPALAGSVSLSPLDFGLKTVSGSYTVVATNTVTACSSNMAGSATVTISAAPLANIVTGGGSYCAGGTGVAIGLNG
jgi:hypothetical protein